MKYNGNQASNYQNERFCLLKECDFRIVLSDLFLSHSPRSSQTNRKCREKSTNFGVLTVEYRNNIKKKSRTLANKHKTENIILNTISESLVGFSLSFILFHIQFCDSLSLCCFFFLYFFSTLILGQFLCFADFKVKLVLNLDSVLC